MKTFVMGVILVMLALSGCNEGGTSEAAQESLSRQNVPAPELQSETLAPPKPPSL